MNWAVETLNAIVDAEPEALPTDMRARFVHISRMIEEFGLERVHEPHVKHVRGALIARLESGRSYPSTQTLERLAVATGTRLKIVFEPEVASGVSRK